MDHFLDLLQTPPTSHQLMIFVVLYILLLEVTPPSILPPFLARKLCHSGCGFCIMLLSPHSPANRTFVYLVALSTISTTWSLIPSLPKLRFSRERDVGITAYLTLVSIWFNLKMDPKILAPVFFADPAGAVVGRTMSSLGLNVRVYGSKTLFGSMAVGGFTYLCVMYECKGWERLVISAAATVGEAIGGEWDNAVIAAVVLGGWHLTGRGDS
ncbi:hypothetical protein TrCOL_g6052 [Triparma columacea]|uniref:Uncharacterized protein n=1 Tax=Triparma columacea TaxID=722753 RepID=A0A9W7GCC1_9STRA|nr:hypothetical protein TrCOL_g6052 [Triparma columacea]